MKKILACVMVVAALALCGCASTQSSTGTASSAVASAASTASSTAAQFEIPHRYASASEGKDGNGYESPEIIEGVIAYLRH